MIEKAFLITTKSPEALEQRVLHIKKALHCDDDFIEVLRNTRNTKDPVKGCFEAHMNAYHEMVVRGYRSCLILEDDVHFMRPVNIEGLKEKIKNLSFDLFYLGHRPVYKQKTWIKATSSKGIVQVRTNDRHAIIISDSYAKRVIEMPWTGKNGDVILRNHTENAFALYPMVAIQTGPLSSQSFKNGFSELMNEYIQMGRQRAFFGSLLMKTWLPIHSIRVLIKLVLISLKSK